VVAQVLVKQQLLQIKTVVQVVVVRALASVTIEVLELLVKEIMVEFRYQLQVLGTDLASQVAVVAVLEVLVETLDSITKEELVVLELL
jgi:hypothetical protein